MKILIFPVIVNLFFIPYAESQDTNLEKKDAILFDLIKSTEAEYLQLQDQILETENQLYLLRELDRLTVESNDDILSKSVPGNNLTTVQPLEIEIPIYSQ